MEIEKGMFRKARTHNIRSCPRRGRGRLKVSTLGGKRKSLNTEQVVKNGSTQEIEPKGGAEKISNLRKTEGMNASMNRGRGWVRKSTQEEEPRGEKRESGINPMQSIKAGLGGEVLPKSRQIESGKFIIS